jgi:hypothetical protein
VAVFEFQLENTSIILPGGRRFTNGALRVIEVPEGEVADALRSCASPVQELSELPHETLRRYTKVSNDGAIYPLPDFEGKTALVVGRGLSAVGFHERYGEGYVVCGVNPASIPLGQRDDPTDGVHAGFYEFDCVFSLDQYYYKQEYLKQYRGPVLGPSAHAGQYFGPGTYHKISHFIKVDASLSFGLALLGCAALGAKDIVLVGCDFDGDYAGLKASARLSMKQAEDAGATVWVAPENLWKPEGIEVWNA